MDDNRFDDLTRRLSDAPNRRTLVRGLAAALAGLAAPSPATQAKKKGCPDGRKHCNGRCISRKKCCRNRDCGNGKVCCDGDCQRGDCCGTDDCCAGGDCSAVRNVRCCANRCVRGSCCPGTACGGNCFCKVAAEGEAVCIQRALVECKPCPAAGCPAGTRCVTNACAAGVTAICEPICAT